MPCLFLPWDLWTVVHLLQRRTEEQDIRGQGLALSPLCVTLQCVQLVLSPRADLQHGDLPWGRSELGDSHGSGGIVVRTEEDLGERADLEGQHCLPSQRGADAAGQVARGRGR